MTTIRPNVYPQQAPLGGQPRDDAGRQAARAFFQAALGQTQAPTAAASVADPAPVQRTVQAAPTAPTDAPQRIARPGSLLDIRV